MDLHLFNLAGLPWFAPVYPGLCQCLLLPTYIMIIARCTVDDLSTSCCYHGLPILPVLTCICKLLH